MVATTFSILNIEFTNILKELLQLGFKYRVAYWAGMFLSLNFKPVSKLGHLSPKFNMLIKKLS